MQQRELEENLDDLGHIVAAVESRDMDMARHLAEAHVRRFNHYMENRKANWSPE
jgi:DNA-binding GntR family transcriptional regulator